MWSYASTSTGLPTFQVAMARHADSFGVGNIDTIAAEAQFVPPSTCQVFAWSSLGGSSTPAWSVNVSNCDANLLYDDDRNVDISDDGSTAVFSGFLIQGKDYIPQLWVFSAQTGKLRYTKNLGATGAGGPVQLSENGTWVAWTTGDSVMVLDGLTGKVRDTVQMGWNCMAVLSDSGDYLAFAGQDVGKIYKWDATNSQYTLAYSPVPSGATQWYATSAAISSDGSGTAEAELVTFGYITQTALGARVIIYSMVTGAVMSDYTSPVNAQLQTYPTVRMSGNYAGVCLWGDSADGERKRASPPPNAPNLRCSVYTDPPPTPAPRRNVRQRSADRRRALGHVCQARLHVHNARFYVWRGHSARCGCLHSHQRCGLHW